MFRPGRVTTLIVCISLLVIMLAGSAFAETMGQKVLRLRRQDNETEQSSSYTRSKYSRTGEEAKAPEEQEEIEEIAEEVVEVTPQPVKAAPEKLVVAPVIKRPAINANDPLRLVPEDALVCVRINNFNGSLSALDQYLTGVSPFPLGMMATAQIGTIIGNPMLSGIDFQGDVLLTARFAPDMGQPSIAVFIPVTSYEEFTRGNPNCSDADAEGFSAITPPQGMLGELISIRSPGGKYAIVAQAGSKTAVLEMVNSARKRKGLASGLSRAELKMANRSPIWVYGNIEKAAELFMPVLENLLRSTQAMKNQAVIDSGGDTLKTWQDSDMAVMTDSINQLKSLSLTLTPSNDKLVLSMAFTAKEGSDFARLCATNAYPAKDFTLAGYLKKDSAMNFVAKIDKSLLRQQLDLSIKMNSFEYFGFSKEELKFADKMIDSIGDEMVYSYSLTSGDVPISFNLIAKANDTDKMKDSVGWFFDMTSHSPETSNITIEGTDNYNGSLIHTMSVALPDPVDGAGMSQMNMKMSMTVANDLLLCNAGNSSLDDLKDLIDMTSGGPGKPVGDIRVALRIAGDSGDYDMVGSYNIIRALAGINNLMKSSSGGQLAGPFSMFEGLNTQTKSCMAITGKIDDGTANIQLILPKEHLTEVMGAFMQMQMQQMQTIQNN